MAKDYSLLIMCALNALTFDEALEYTRLYLVSNTQMQRIYVEERKSITEKELFDLTSVASSLP